MVEYVDIVNNPENADDGVRSVPFSGRAVHRARRLHGRAGAEVLPPVARQRGPAARRLSRHRTDFDEDADGNVIKVYATYDPATSGGNAPDGRKVKSTMHWVSAAHARRRDGRAVRAAVRRPRCRARRPATRSTTSTPTRASCSPTARSSRRSPTRRPATVVQFERLGYFAHDPDTPMLFHRTVGLRDEWANIQKRN